MLLGKSLYLVKGLLSSTIKIRYMVYPTLDFEDSITGKCLQNVTTRSIFNGY